MQGNSSNGYYNGCRYNPGQEVIIKGRHAIISDGGGYISSRLGTICYSGRFLDNNHEECFIDIPELLISENCTA